MIMKLIITTSYILFLVVQICLSQIEDNGESINFVTRECNHKLMQIDSIDKFRAFMKHYKVVINGFAKPKKGVLNLEKKLRKCFELRESLLALEDVVDRSRNGVCRMEFINHLVEFYLKYLIKGDQDNTSDMLVGPSNRLNLSYDAYFFSIFAQQVALICKSKIDDRLMAAQAKHDCSSILSKFGPSIWSKFDNSYQISDNNENIQRVSDFLAHFKRVEDFAPLHRAIKEPYFNVIISKETIFKINQLKDDCRAREPYYTALFSPVATLAQIGFSIEDSNHNSQGHLTNKKSTKLLSCWLATAQFCQGILRTHLNLGDDDPNTNDKKLVEIKFGDPPPDVDTNPAYGSEEVSFVDTIDQISPIVIKSVSKKVSMKGKLKRKVLVWAQNFIVSHMDIEKKRNGVIGQFIEALTQEENAIDSGVAFNGKKVKDKSVNPVTFVTDDTDGFIQASTIFINKEISLLLSSVVAVALSAVSVYFAMYAIASSVRLHYSPDDTDNFKQGWREMRDNRMKKIEDKVQKKRWIDKFNVYKPN